MITSASLYMREILFAAVRRFRFIIGALYNILSAGPLTGVCLHEPELNGPIL